MDKVRAIREIEIGTNADLAAYIGVPASRASEWTSGAREPKAQTVIEIQEWIASKEELIRKDKTMMAAYCAAIEKFRKEA